MMVDDDDDHDDDDDDDDAAAADDYEDDDYEDADAGECFLNVLKCFSQTRLRMGGTTESKDPFVFALHR